jgi:hypothetical protein
MSYQYHKDNTIPEEREGYIWVFGSNLKGIHGKGAAKVAHVNFGAQYGVGRARMGMSYAIPTKATPYRDTLWTYIVLEVQAFIEYAREHPQEKFFVTRVGCGNAGYPDADMAPLFKGAPTNCHFAQEWKPYLE